MDTQEFLAKLVNKETALARMPHFLYAQYGKSNGASCITLTYNTEPKKCIETFEDETSCQLWWDELVEIMTTLCRPHCVQIGETILFQPKYLFQIARYSNEMSHFVILDFTNEQNLWLSFKERERQFAFYLLLSRVLGPAFVPQGLDPSERK